MNYSSEKGEEKRTTYHSSYDKGKVRDRVQLSFWAIIRKFIGLLPVMSRTRKQWQYTPTCTPSFPCSNSLLQNDTDTLHSCELFLMWHWNLWRSEVSPYGNADLTWKLSKHWKIIDMDEPPTGKDWFTFVAHTGAVPVNVISVKSLLYVKLSEALYCPQTDSHWQLAFYTYCYSQNAKH